MPLPLLLKFVYTNGTDEVIRRGKRIFVMGGAELVQVDPLLKTALFRVKSDTHANSYRVTISKYNEPRGLSVRCQCPYNLGDICRHEAAALFQLQDLVDKNRLDEDDMQYDQKHTVVKMKCIDLKVMRLFTSQANFAAAEHIARHHQAAIVRAADECVEATLVFEGETFPLVIRRNEERNFESSCPCGETKHPLCKHKTALLLQLLDAYGPYYFDTLRNWDKEKNKLLAQYGYSLDDDLDDKFAFTHVNGKPFLRVLDPSIRKLSAPEVPLERAPAQTEELEEEPAQAGSKRIGVVFSDRGEGYPYLKTDLIAGEANEAGDGFASVAQVLELTRYIDYYRYPAADRELIAPVRKLHATELNKFLNRNSMYAGLWENIFHDDGRELPDDTREMMLDYLHSRLLRLFPILSSRSLNFWLPRGKPLRTANLQPISLHAEGLVPRLEARKENKEVVLHCHVLLDGERVPVSDNASGTPLFFLHGGRLALYRSPKDAMMAESFLPEGVKRIPLKDWPDYLKTVLLPLSLNHPVDFGEELVEEKRGGRVLQPSLGIRLKELGDMFLLHPVFLYEGYEAVWDDGDRITVQEGDKVVVIRRDREAEQAFVERLRSLHERFAYPSHHRYFYLRSREALQKNWFFRFMDAMKEMDVRLFGFEDLKNFRFNPNRPLMHMKLSGGMDWFDAQVEVQYGDQQVSVRSLKKALQDKQNYVPLGDGSLGLLPDEWLKKYGLLFRMGEETDKGLRLSKYNFSVIDELYDHIDDETLQQELAEKKQRLLNIESMPLVPLPDNIRAVLRAYQESGFQWLNYLDAIRWGGILADDMGLGKTLQALSFLQHYKNKHGRCLALVVCPTTLIYNWENEIRKFTPELSYHIHHGPARLRQAGELSGSDILITTYGTLRSDIQLLMQLPFDYAILDESQAIKNPHSKVTKAAQLLQARNRLCLSGTPMQNNTFDLYAQMHFLNPGMLGSVDFFRTEFSMPIDKLQDEESKAHLRRLIYPFMLRRTKEQVARDLPEKTETVLFCEMDAEQRHIYDAYRNEFRSKILGTIDEQGIERSQLTILQGLMKLRQICDSPAILKDEELPNHSVKLQELVRELQENTGDHKVLVFSQFLGMLGLIREKLQRLHIPFEYFDGSTTAPERERAIRNFQEDDQCRVFLISLKAGGVGLNLTAADYVYIVDPWWNPAVEQQAIDRTHRIGQTKSIFAYRMICKDTVEEKILQLQEKKKSLVRDIIADEGGFIKKLSREDVLYLFS